MTDLQLLIIRFNELESTLLKLNISERLVECEKELNAIRDGKAGFYPSKKLEKELKVIRKVISTLKK